jgi:predicted RNA-binding Zn ribbon-like protein
MSRWTYRAGGAEVSLDPDPEAALRELTDQLLPGVRATLRAEVDRWYAQVRAAWPVSDRPRGPSNPTHSADQLEAFEEFLGDGIAVGIASPAPYTKFIRTSQNEINGNPWQVLVKKRAPVEAERVVDALNTALAEAAREVLRGG